MDNEELKNFVQSLLDTIDMMVTDRKEERHLRAELKQNDRENRIGLIKFVAVAICITNFLVFLSMSIMFYNLWATEIKYSYDYSDMNISNTATAKIERTDGGE